MGKIYPIPQQPYIACEDLFLDWDPRSIPIFDQMWNEGYCITYIADAFDRDVDEVAILVIDRKSKGFIKDRPGGAYRKGMK
jgi:hypothetical protein